MYKLHLLIIAFEQNTKNKDANLTHGLPSISFIFLLFVFVNLLSHNDIY